MTGRVRGDRIRVGTRVKTWFMSGGTPALKIEPYTGPLAYLWPAGARTIWFGALTRSGRVPMTVDNAEYFERG